MTGAPLRQTPIHADHVALGAKLVPFAGYEMPVQYPTGITAEHRAVREAAGLFDVSHMGEVFVSGPDARNFVQHLLTNDVDRIEPGQAQYSTMVDDDGHVLDDLLVYRFEDAFMLVVNASNAGKDLAWIRDHAAAFDVGIQDTSDETGLLALQGPKAESILARLTDTDLPAIGYYRFVEGDVHGVRTIISRTGYTGEDGFELYLPADRAAGVWRAILDAGREDGLIPAGLGARDSLRLEMGYALYGNDIDRTRTPLDAGLGWVVKLDKGDFVGRDALRRQKEAGPAVRLAGFLLEDRGFPRHGYTVRTEQGDGVVTSGVASPSVGKGIGLAYVPTAAAKVGTAVSVVIRGKDVPARIVRPPFYTEGSVRS